MLQHEPILLQQGWKQEGGKQVVAAVMIRFQSPYWSVFEGSYDPSQGQNLNHTQWKFLSTSAALTDALEHAVFPTIMTWIGSQALVQDLQQAVAALRKSAEDIAHTIEAKCGGTAA